MGYGMLWGVEYEKRKRRKRKKKEEKESCLLPASARAGFASLVLQPELNEERISHLRELNNFRIRGSAGQKAPL